MVKMCNKLIGRICVTLFLCLFINPLLLAESNDLIVHYIDVGQGDAILLESPCDRVALIDGGDRYQLVQDVLLKYLQEQEIEKIHKIFVSHPHADHIGGLLAVLQAHPVKKVYSTGREASSKTFQNVMELIEEKFIPHKIAKKGDVIHFGEEISFHVLYPEEGFGEKSVNNASMTLCLEYDDVSFLFTGDIEKEGELALLQSSVELDATVLKVPHHGSKSSSTLEFLEAVDPELAIIQVGDNNPYGHPSDIILDRYDTLGIQVLRNDQQGNIMISTDGEDIDISTEYSPVEEDGEEDGEIGEDTFLGSRASNRYHFHHCHHADQINEENIIWFQGVVEAMKKGYQPCGVCNPPGEL